MIRPLSRHGTPSPVSKAVDHFLQGSLLGMLASGYFAVALTGSLDSPTLAVTGGAIVLRALMLAGIARARLSDRFTTALAVAYIGFYPIDYQFISGEFLTATVHLVFFLAAVLVVKASTRRDYFFLKLIALMEILAASLLSTSVHFLLWLGVFLLCAVAAQTSGELDANLKARGTVAREGIRGTHRRLGGLVLFLFAGILMAGAALFFLLPRTANAALRHFIPDRYHLPGFSNEVVLGQIGELRMTSTPVMHVRIYGAPQPVSLKWRGSALSQFDGRRWFNEVDRGERLTAESGLVRLASNAQRWRKGRRIFYDVQLKSAATDVLFFAGTPEWVSIEPPQVIRTAVDGYRWSGGVGEGIRYRAHSFLEEPEPHPNPALTELSAQDRSIYLRTPATMDPRIPELARRLAHGVNDFERARAIERHLRTSYGYTTELLSREVPDPIAHFLFQRRKGHCEYFASAMALILRSAGIPSRVATGFQSGVFNPISGWYLIRAADAHSWIEAWIPSQGWTTFDPTPADLSARGSSAWAQIQLYFDALDVFWQEWVMSYDLERQVLLADRMGRSGRSFSTDWRRVFELWAGRWAQWKSAMTVSLAIAAAGTLVWLGLALWYSPRLWAWWKTRRRLQALQSALGQASDATILYRRMLRTLRRRGLQKPAWVTPAEFAAMVPRGESRRIVEQLTREYNELRFGGRGESAPRMLVLLEALEQSARR
jgi:transglutaminase-like putative cysteine protease